MGPTPDSTQAGEPRGGSRGWLRELLPSRTRGNLPDQIYVVLLRGVGLVTPLLFSLIVLRIGAASWPAIRSFGAGFVTSTDWNPVLREFGALPFIYGTIVSSFLALVIALPLALGLAIFLTELAPRWLAAPVAFATELLAAIPSVVYGLWGIFVLVPFRGRDGARPSIISFPSTRIHTCTELQLLSYPISASTHLIYSIVSVRTASKLAFKGVAPSSTIPRKAMLKSSLVINGMYSVM